MLKKILATALAAAMIFGLASVAFAGFSDTAGNTNEKAIVKLAVLEVLIGYTDGTYKPAGNITRAEFAAVVVRALGYQSSARLLTNAPAFSDCAGAQWAWGYINVATSQGIIKGYPGGTFAPNANVTIAEAITMIVRAIGRDEEATGIWPAGHIMVASKEGILLSDLPGVDVAATRGVVAALVAKAIATPMVKKNLETGKFDAIDPPNTFLARNSAILVTGTVADVDTTYNTVTIVATEYDLASGVQFAGATTLSAFKGQNVEAFLNDDDEVIYLGTKTTTGITGTVTAIDKVAKTVTVGGTAYTVLDAATAYFNGTALPGDAVSKITNLKDATIALVLNADGKVSYFEATKLDQTNKKIEAKQTVWVGSTKVDKITISGNTYTVNSDAKFVRNGSAAAWADLLINDSVNYAVNPSGEVTYIDAYAVKVSGVLQEKVNTNNHATFKVNDVVYAVAVDTDGYDDFDDTSPASVPGQNIVLTLDRNGKVTTVALQAATATAAVTLQSKVQTYDANNAPVRRMTLSDGTTVTLSSSAAIYRNVVEYTDIDKGFGKLATGDSLVLSYDSTGKATVVKAFASTSGYVRIDGGTVYVNSSVAGTGTDYAIVLPKNNYSMLLKNGVQTVVTGPGYAVATDEIKIVSWVVTATEQYPNLIVRSFVDTKGYYSIKGITNDADGNKILYLHNGTVTVADVWAEIVPSTIIQRTDVAESAANLVIGNKVKFSATVGDGGDGTPYELVYVYAAATDTTAPGFRTGYSPTVAGLAVSFRVTEDVIVTYKVYNAAGEKVYTSSALELPGALSTATGFTWHGKVSDAADAAAAPVGTYTIVFTMKDYAGNVSVPYSVTVTKS